MLELMKLEIKKFKLYRFLKMVLLVIAGSMLFITFPLLGQATIDKFTYTSAFSMVGLVVNTAFLVVSAILMATLVISEYNNKTILVMFTYPIDRFKLMRAKLVLLCTATVACLVVGYACTTAYVLALDHFFDILQGAFGTIEIRALALEIAMRIVMSGILCLIPFVAGMWRQSVPTTIVSTAIVVFAMQLVVSESPGPLWMALSAVVLMVIVLLLVHLTFCKKLSDLDAL